MLIPREGERGRGGEGERGRGGEGGGGEGEGKRGEVSESDREEKMEYKINMKVVEEVILGVQANKACKMKKKKTNK